ncbi:MAG: DNA primase [Candidatus Pacebacteria bacterium]|nr:DNA primase [Candidatus Paceibacterota bacterium]
MSTDTEKIKDKLTVESVVGSYVKLEHAGKNLRAKCPFHAEKTASFVVTPERGIYHCFGCGKGGDIFDFVQEIEHCEFSDALKLLAERAGVTLSASRTAPGETSSKQVLYDLLDYAAKCYEVAFRKDEKAVAYLESRGLLRETMKSFRIGYAPAGWTYIYDNLRKKNFSDSDIVRSGLCIKHERGSYYDRFRERIMFPIMDGAGRVVGFSGRVMPGSDEEKREGAGKYVNSPETDVFKKSRLLFGYDKAKQSMLERSRAILVEGQMDLIMAHQAGTTEALAISGTACTPEHLALIFRFTDTLVLALDRDPAGVKAAGKTAALAYAAGLDVQAIELPSGKDPADSIRESSDEWHAAIKTPTDFLVMRARVLAETGDRKEILKQVRIELFPLLQFQSSELIRDEKLHMLARTLDLSVDALRTDFARALKDARATPQSASSAKVDVGLASSSLPPTHSLISEMLGLLSLPVMNSELDRVRTWYDGLEKPGAWEALSEAHKGEMPRLATSADLMYRGLDTPKLHRILEELMTRYELMNHEHHMDELLVQLRQAETANNHSEAQRLLGDISLCLRTIHELRSHLS